MFRVHLSPRVLRLNTCVPMSRVKVASRFSRFQVVTRRARARSPVDRGRRHHVDNPELTPSPSRRDMYNRAMNLSRMFRRTFRPFPPSTSTLLPLNLFPSRRLAYVRRAGLRQRPITQPVHHRHSKDVVGRFVRPYTRTMFAGRVTTSNRRFNVVTCLRPVRCSRVRIRIRQP